MKFTEAKESDAITLSVAPCIRKGIGLEIGRGCIHGCLYCFSACATEKSGTVKEVEYFTNAAVILERFLQMHSGEVENVHLGYVTDFMQDPESESVNQIRREVLEVLLRYDVNISCLTKGKVTAEAKELIEKMGDRFTLMVDFGCGDVRWEKNVKSLESRLLDLPVCKKGGRVDPIIPGVSDSHEAFKSYVHMAALAGITDIDCSFLFLTDDVSDAVEREFGADALDSLYGNYSDGCEEFLNGAIAWTGREVNMEDIRYKIDTIALPSPNVSYRMEKVKLFQEIGKAYGVTVRLCSCKNRSMKGCVGFCSDSRNLRK